jgi:hypothetical protein
MKTGKLLRCDLVGLLVQNCCAEPLGSLIIPQPSPGDVSVVDCQDLAAVMVRR